jgi:hypothetical protein
MSAIISDCGLYRYRLERHALSGAGSVAWIMVNPSTADATTDDATIRKVIGFSERMGAGWAIVGNKFAALCRKHTYAGAFAAETDEQHHQMRCVDSALRCGGAEPVMREEPG